MMTRQIERLLFPSVVAITGVGFVLQLLGYFLPYWYIIEYTENYISNIGLFYSHTCKNGTCVDMWYGHKVDKWLDGELLYTNRWIQTFSLIFGVLGFVCSIVQLVNRERGQLRKNWSHTAFFVFSLPAGFLALVGVIVYVSKESSQYGGENGWCYILTVIGAMLLLISALLSCVWCRDKRNDYDDRLAAKYLYPIIQTY